MKTQERTTRTVVLNLFGRVGSASERPDEPLITLSAIARQLTTIISRNGQNGVLYKPILLISSRGGSTDDALCIYTYLAHLPIEITTVAVGLVESAATYIFLAGKHRIALPTSMFLFHDGNIQTNSACSDFQAVAIAESKKARTMIDIVARAIGNRKLATRWHRQTCVLTAQEAKETGVVHEIKDVAFPCDSLEHPDNIL